jgi:hypothetical protein
VAVSDLAGKVFARCGQNQPAIFFIFEKAPGFYFYGALADKSRALNAFAI